MKLAMCGEGVKGDVRLSCVQGHSSEVICVHFNSTGSQLATGSFDHTSIVWDTHTGR